MSKIYEIDEKSKYYPKNLLAIKNHPKKIYIMGNRKILNNNSIVIVGLKNNTKYGERVARLYASGFSKAGITVISGLSTGIETIVHENSMNYRGKTIAVLGSGFNYIYPNENKKLVQKIIKNGGAIISEYSPNSNVNLSGFPMRSRIMAAMGRCTIVIDGNYRAGSSITARQTYLQDKPVFCIPGKIGTKTGTGSNSLINNKVKILTNVNDLLNLFVNEKSNIHVPPAIHIQKSYTKIYDIVSKQDISIKDLSKQLGVDINALRIKLKQMEEDELIKITKKDIIKTLEYR